VRCLWSGTGATLHTAKEVGILLYSEASNQR